MWVNEKTGGVFVLHSDIRYECWKEHIELPGILTDEVLAGVGYQPVCQRSVSYDPITQGITALPPAKNEQDLWEQHFSIYELDPAIVANNQNIAESTRKSQIHMQMQMLDAKSIRALRENDQDRLDIIEAQIAHLRGQL